MSLDVTTTERSVIDLDGHFNPMIFQPDWLLGKELIDELEHQVLLKAEDVVVAPQYAALRLPWVDVRVLRDEMRIASGLESETPDRIRDLAHGFLTHLPETPITRMGLSHFWHLDGDPGDWTALSELLAPSEPWTGALGNAKVATLVIDAPYADNSTVSVVLEPSHREGKAVFVQVNFAFPSSDQDGGAPALEVRGRLEAVWPDTRRYAREIVLHLVNQ